MVAHYTQKLSWGRVASQRLLFEWPQIAGKETLQRGRKGKLRQTFRLDTARKFRKLPGPARERRVTAPAR